MRASQLRIGQFCEPLAGERVEGTTPDTEDTKIDRFHIS